MRQYGFITIDAHFQCCLNWAWLLRNQLPLLLMERCLDSTARGVSIRRVCFLSAAGVPCMRERAKDASKERSYCIRRSNETEYHTSSIG